MNEEQNYDGNQEVHSEVVRAGKRTYFFDVKATKGNDLYLTITESKKTFQNGRPSFQKHKIFLYKEDFEKFSDTLKEVIQKIDEIKQSGNYVTEDINASNGYDTTDDYSSVNFEDL